MSCQPEQREESAFSTIGLGCPGEGQIPRCAQDDSVLASFAKATLFAGLLAGSMLPQATPAQSNTSDRPHTLLLAVNKGDQNVVLIDPEDRNVIAAIPADGNTPHEVAATPDGRLAFVPIYSNANLGKPGTDGNTIDVIDLKQRQIVHRIHFDHGVRPHLPVYDKRRDLLYVTTELNQSIAVIDPHTFQIVGSIPTGRPETHMFVLSHDGHRAYTTNVGSGTVSVLDLDARKLLAVVPVAGKIQRISISQDDRHVFTSDATKPEFDEIDTRTQKVTTHSLPAMSFGTLALPDGKTLLMTMPSLNKVALYSLRTGDVTGSMDVCANPQELVLDPQNEGTVYVSCMTSGQVGILDLKQARQTAVVDSGHATDGLAATTLLESGNGAPESVKVTETMRNR